MTYIIDNYLWFVFFGALIFMTILGYIAEKTNFGSNTNSKKEKSGKNNETNRIDIKNLPERTINLNDLGIENNQQKDVFITGEEIINQNAINEETVQAQDINVPLNFEQIDGNNETNPAQVNESYIDALPSDFEQIDNTMNVDNVPLQVSEQIDNTMNVGNVPLQVSEQLSTDNVPLGFELPVEQNDSNDLKSKYEFVDLLNLDLENNVGNEETPQNIGNFIETDMNVEENNIVEEQSLSEINEDNIWNF